MHQQIVYRRYASLFFICEIGEEDNELITLEVIHRYVESLDRYFGNVCRCPVTTPRKILTMKTGLRTRLVSTLFAASVSAAFTMHPEFSISKRLTRYDAVNAHVPLGKLIFRADSGRIGHCRRVARLILKERSEKCMVACIILSYDEH